MDVTKWLFYMDRENNNTKDEVKYSALGDVIPAFLAPDHILGQSHLKNKIIDNIDNDKINSNNVEFLSKEHHDDITSNIIIRKCLQDAVEHNYIDAFVQPIVTLPQRHISFYELYGRLRVISGVYLPAQEYMPLAANEPMLNHLDALLLLHFVKMLSKQRKNHNRYNLACFVNIKPSTLQNRLFVGNLLTLLSHNKFIAKSLIFEIKYSDFLMLSPKEQKILNGLAEIGCRFSLDHIDELPKDIKLLQANSICFVKIAAQSLLKNSNSESRFSEILSYKHNLEVNGIDVIIEKIETKKILLQILDFDFKYGQGFLFGKPDFQGVHTK